MFYFLRASLAIQSVLSTCLQPSAKYSKQVTPLPPEKKMNPHTYIHQTFTYSPIHTRIKLFAFVNSPKVVCLEDSLPTGTMSFNFSKQYLKCARLLDRIFFFLNLRQEPKIAIWLCFMLCLKLPCKRFNCDVYISQNVNIELQRLPNPSCIDPCKIKFFFFTSKLKRNILHWIEKKEIVSLYQVSVGKIRLT